MKSIVVTYPDFQSLPKGVKRMLVASESHFFEEAKSCLQTREEVEQDTLAALHEHSRPWAAPARTWFHFLGGLKQPRLYRTNLLDLRGA